MQNNFFKNVIKSLLIRANTVLDKSVFDCINNNYTVLDKKNFIIENCRIAKENNRPLCQDTGQILCFLKIPFGFSFGFDFKATINQAIKEIYQEEFYRKSVVKDSLYDRNNTATNAPAIIYTDFENRESVRIDILIKGGGAENMSFIKMFNPTSSLEYIADELKKELSYRIINACPPLFIGIGVGGTMDYAALLSKKALFEGIENDFTNKIKSKDVISVKIKTSSSHIASLPIAVTVNCHSNRHAGCEIGKNGALFNNCEYDIPNLTFDFSSYKKITTIDEFNNLKKGENFLFSGEVYTMRDMAHKRISQMIENGEKLPFELKKSIIFYAGPAPKKKDEIIGPIGPTTSKRMDDYAPLLYDLGCIATIGKGERSQCVKDACLRNNAYYFTTQGGIACLLQKCVKKSEIIAFEDLGAEAIFKLYVENLPLNYV